MIDQIPPTTTIFCCKCNEPVEIPDELMGEYTVSDVVNFVCDACDQDIPFYEHPAFLGLDDDELEDDCEDDPRRNGALAERTDANG